MHEEPAEHPGHMEIRQISLAASRPVWSLIAALFGLLFAGGSYWLQTVYAEGQETQAVTHDTQRRVDTVEQRLQSIEDGQKRIEASASENFDKLDRKLDALIERELDRQ